MTPNSKSIQRSIQIGIKRPILGITLLANNFAKCIEDTSITKDLKVRLCLLLLQKIIDKTYANHNNTVLSSRLQNRSIYFGIRLLKRYPKQGLDVLSNLIIYELVNNQNCSQDELLLFYNKVFYRLFPGCK